MFFIPRVSGLRDAQLLSLFSLFSASLQEHLEAATVSHKLLLLGKKGWKGREANPHLDTGPFLGTSGLC